MPGYNNRFKSPEYIEATIQKDYDGSTEIVGVIRVKPSGVLWKPKGQHKFYSVTIDAFEKWIASESASAKQVKH